MSDLISIILPDGSRKELPAGTTGMQFAESIGSRLAKVAVIVEVDGKEKDLAAELPDRATVSVVTEDSARGLFTLRHSTAHVMAQAVLGLWPGAYFAIGPPIEDGFYYDFELPGGAHFVPEDLERIEARMREIIAANQPFIRREHGIEEALELFKSQPYKVELINGNDDPMAGVEHNLVSSYENPPEFIDLCRGPHVPHTGRLGHFKLMRSAGAYWRGNSDNAQLQRIYGTAWAKKQDLVDYLERLEQAKLRDHRKLGEELDLFHIDDVVGPGLVLYHPKGGIIRREMEDFSRQEHEKAGYQFVYTPHIAKAALFEQSGHLGYYAESMYPPMELEDATYYPKPMNCPMHMRIYSDRQRSWRELPMRLFEFGQVYRYELSGALNGMLRVRGFTQDDSHIFCTPEQLGDELIALLDFVLHVVKAFGFEDFKAFLSTRPDDKAIGDVQDWENAQDALRAAIEKSGLPYEVDEGGGAFYGPKIDLKLKDALGREWQLSTIQVDFQLPPRFDLEYVGSDNARHRPVVIHRALFGSVDRFFATLIEHYAGAFPVWLSPVQVSVLPVKDDIDDYAQEVAQQLRSDGVRVEVMFADEPLGARIRKAKLDKQPYVLVVGEDDLANKTVGVNARGHEVERGVTVDEFHRRIRTAIDERRTDV